jgi:hypothetical protein
MTNKGYGIELNNVVLLGGLALVGYVAYKTLSPLWSVEKSASDFGSSVGNLASDVVGVGDKIVSYVSKGIDKGVEIGVDAVNTGANVVKRIPDEIDITNRDGMGGAAIAGGSVIGELIARTVGNSTNSNTVLNPSALTPQATLNALTTNTSTASQISGALGLNSKAAVIVSQPTTTQATTAAQSFTNPKTGSVVTRGSGSLLSGRGFN